MVQRRAFGKNAGQEDENESCQNEYQMGQGSWAEAWQIGAGDCYILEERENSPHFHVIKENQKGRRSSLQTPCFCLGNEQQSSYHAIFPLGTQEEATQWSHGSDHRSYTKT